MNYPSDKNKTKIDKIVSYLVYIEVGGEQGNWQCMNVDYKICNGNNDEEIIKDWLGKVGLSFDDCFKYNNNWTWKGRKIVIVPLYEYWNGGIDNWKSLNWQ